MAFSHQNNLNFLFLIDDLKNQIIRQSNEEKDSTKRSILGIALASLKNAKQESPDKLPDLYCTINHVVHICNAENDEKSEKNLQIRIIEFFITREEALRDDSHDYCYMTSLANQFCYDLAKILFPSQNPFNVLLDNVLGHDIELIYQDQEIPTNDGIKPNKLYLYLNEARQLKCMLRGQQGKIEELPTDNLDPDGTIALTLYGCTFHILQERPPQHEWRNYKNSFVLVPNPQTDRKTLYQVASDGTYAPALTPAAIPVSIKQPDGTYVTRLREKKENEKTEEDKKKEEKISELQQHLEKTHAVYLSFQEIEQWIPSENTIRKPLSSKERNTLYNIAAQNGYRHFENVRKHPWKNPITGDHNLPESAADFFISPEDRRIHLYRPILDQLIEGLKASLQQPLAGSDIDDEEKQDKPLFPADLNILKARAKTFEKLLFYKEIITIAEEKDSIYHHLSKLRIGLYKGSVKTNVDYDYDAGKEANIAVVEFYKWWNTLSDDIQNKIRYVRANSVYLGGVIDMILDANTKDRSNAYYCVDLKGRALEGILENDGARATLLKIDKTLDYRLSPSILNAYKITVLDELNTTHLNIPTSRNIFKLLTEHCYILRDFINMDYGVVLHLKRIVETLFGTTCDSFTQINAEKEDIAINKLSSLSDDQLDPNALLVFYNILPGKHVLLSTTVALKLFLLHKEKKAFPPNLLMLFKTSFKNLPMLLQHAVRNKNLHLVSTILELNLVNLKLSITPVFVVGAKLDVLDIVQRWCSAVILERKETQVKIHYERWNIKWDEWIDIEDEWIDIEKEAGRFAVYHSRDKHNTSIPQDSLLDVAFSNNDAEMAVLLVKHQEEKDLNPPVVQNQLLAKTTQEWNFVWNYLIGIGKEHWHPDFLKKLFSRATAMPNDIFASLLSQIIHDPSSLKEFLMHHNGSFVDVEKISIFWKAAKPIIQSVNDSNELIQLINALFQVNSGQLASHRETFLEKGYRWQNNEDKASRAVAVSAKWIELIHFAKNKICEDAEKGYFKKRMKTSFDFYVPRQP